MPLAYTKDFLINVALYRFNCLPKDDVESMRPMFEKDYDTYGKDTFRKHTSVTPELIREYNEYCKRK